MVELTSQKGRIWVSVIAMAFLQDILFRAKRSTSTWPVFGPH